MSLLILRLRDSRYIGRHLLLLSMKGLVWVLKGLLMPVASKVLTSLIMAG